MALLKTLRAVGVDNLVYSDVLRRMEALPK